MTRPLNRSPRAGLSVPLVLAMLAALSTLAFALVKKGSQQAAWALRYVHERTAQEAALAGLAEAENRLLDGRWYLNGLGSFSVTLSDQASVQVVCEDMVKPINPQPSGVITTSQGQFQFSGTVFGLHSIYVMSMGVCHDVRKFAVAKFIVSPEPLVSGGSMEGIRIPTNGASRRYWDELVYSGQCVGNMKRTLKITVFYDPLIKEPLVVPMKFNFQCLVAEGATVKKGDPLMKVWQPQSSGTTNAPYDGKVVKIYQASGEGWPDDVVLDLETGGSFQSAGKTLKTMVRVTPVPDGIIAGGSLDQKTTRAAIRTYFQSLTPMFRRNSEALFQAPPTIADQVTMDDQAALGLIGAPSPDISEVDFVHRLLPGFVPPGLSVEDIPDFKANAKVVLDKAPVTGPSGRTLAFFNVLVGGGWPVSPAIKANALSLPMPEGLGNMVKLLGVGPEGSISEYAAKAGTFRNASFLWTYRYSAELQPSAYPNKDWTGYTMVNGLAYQGLSHSGVQWSDNAYDLEYRGKKVRITDLVLFLNKIISDGDAQPSDGQLPAFPNIISVPMVPGNPSSNAGGGGGGGGGG
ncbi:MAG: hypothetical protein GX442_25640 [Candidatus Riflebacteria bacterium]|nr:hypothetical protein [Candidatus Riflebacteria bacterium]